MYPGLWNILKDWLNLHRAARTRDFPWMLQYARRLEGWNPKEFTCHPELNPPRILVSLDGQPEIIIPKKLARKMVKKPYLLLLWIRKHSYGKGIYEKKEI